MKKIILITGFIFISFLSLAQKNVVPGATKEMVALDTGQVFTIVEQMPSFPGGSTAMQTYIHDNIVYPKAEKDSGISGTCYISCIVEKDGTISNVKVLLGISGAAACNEEAIRVVKSMPVWNPGKISGKLVRVAYHIPVKFTLQ